MPKVGDAPFVEAGFDEDTGDWSTAQLVPDPEGKTLTVSVRAIDKAGRISSISGAIGVDLTPTETTITLPDTTITPTVVNAGVTLLSDDGTWSATVECKNCADEEYITSFLFGPYWTEPMTWQARFRYNFGAR